MGGSNPYIEETKYTPATKKFKVTFLPSGKTIEVDPAQIPYGHNGIPGSILDFSEGIKAGLDTWVALLKAGLYVNMLIPPATPNGEVVLRYSVSAAHRAEDIDAALAIVADAARRTGVIPERGHPVRS